MTIEQKIAAIKKLIEIVKSDQFGPGLWYDGLCIVTAGWINSFHGTYEEKRFLYNMIPPRGPHLVYPGYCWKPGAKEPRIEFLEIQQTEYELIEAGLNKRVEQFNKENQDG